VTVFQARVTPRPASDQSHRRPGAAIGRFYTLREHNCPIAPRVQALAAGTAALLVAFLAAVAVPTAPAQRRPGVDPTARLTVRQLIGQRMIYSYLGTVPPAPLRARIARGEAAGVIVFRHNIASRASLAATVASLQAIRRPPGLRAPLLVMIDQEGGLVKRLSGAPTRSPAALGRIGSTDLARSEGRATARNLRSVGVNVNLAPVVDVGRPGSYQQQTGRSYSSNPGRVSALASGFVRGLQAGGVAATLKHFPGLGTVRQDEDVIVQRVSLPLDVLRRTEEAPFAAGIRAGVALVMMSTAVYPALSSRPAMLSPAVSTGELRGRLGFRGVSITDDITVRGMARFGSPPRLGILAAQAGNDLLLYAGGYTSAAQSADTLLREASAGRISIPATRGSVRRVLALRASL
jgi:beta-N-acetylhexosaminidase